MTVLRKHQTKFGMMKAPGEETRWRAILRREDPQEEKFVYGVRSTGIYCRPGCSARRPRRDRVVFFPGPEAARRAGFRPCRRCQPDAASAPDPRRQLVGRVLSALEESAEGSLTLSRLSAAVGVSPFHLQRTFKRLVGITPRQYLDALRLRRLKSELRKGQDVTRALYEAGYGSSSRLYERAPERLGMTPATYRRGGLGMHIDYTIVGSSFGRLLVAATARGICSVNLDDSNSRLEANLRREFPQAQVRRDRNGLTKWVRPLLRHLEGLEPRLELPLDVHGTTFQWKVWEELRRIPYGSTRSYGEVARRVGRPRGARAVARACATNPVPLVIPCHRVVRGNGHLGGYGLGVERKRALLAKESGVAARRKSAAAPSSPTLE
jgi:AraC family transcriptional regulator of adaptative response/methylated-DNA-[protein]-cysteine methyltransferase